MQRRAFITLFAGAAMRGHPRRVRSRSNGCGGSACLWPSLLMTRKDGQHHYVVQALQQLGSTRPNILRT